MSGPDPVLLAKAETIGRCVARTREAHAASEGFPNDADAQDIAVLNIIRACEAALDIALRLVRVRSLALPSTSSEAFSVLAAANLIDETLARSLRAMVGFRNIAVHDYTRLDLAIVEAIITKDLDDLLGFAGLALRLSPGPDVP